jgi:4-amino-4-deoxy-L-arabinose transferase-like glycosyltransferase
LRSLLLLLLICYLSFFYRLGDYGLFDPDEGRTAVIAKEILQTGNWLTLSHAGNPYYDKPAPYFWLVALGFKVFGLNEFAVRFPSALAASLTVLAIYLWGVLSKDPERGFWGGMMIATSLEFVGLGRGGRMDMMLVFFTTAALLYFLWWKERSDRRRWIWPFYLLLALASLVKGPVGVVLPTLIVGAFIAVERNWTLVRQMRVLSGGALFFLAVAPWYVLAFLKDPQYIQTFLWTHNVMRFVATAPGVNHPEPIYYFLPVLVGGFLPWSLFLPPLIYSLRQRLKEHAGKEEAFFVLWVVTVFACFSLSHNKLPGYILPLFPPLGLLAADFLRREAAREGEKNSSSLWLFGGALLWLLSILFLSPITEAVLRKRNAQLLPFDPPIYPALLLLVSLGSAQWLRRQRWLPWIVCLSVVWVSAWLFAAKADDIASIKSARGLALLVNSSAVRDFRAIALRTGSFSFYLDTPILSVSDRDAIEKMLQEPIPTVALVGDRHVREMSSNGSGRLFIWKRIPREAAVIANFPYQPASNGAYDSARSH